MKTIWKNVVTGWNSIKIFRVLAGVLIVSSGISERFTPLILLGAVFFIFALVTPGVCCGMYSPPGRINKSSDSNEVEYEELGTK